MHFGPRMGIERCGKINVMNSGPDSCTGIGVVVRSFVILLIPEQLRQKHEQASPESPIIANNTRSYGNGETRNHLMPMAVAPAQSSDLVTAAYRAILGRDPDPGGFAHYRNKFADGLTETAIREMLSELLRSEEFATKLARKG